MQMKKTLSVIFAALILCSSFMSVTSGQFQVTPTACDLWVQNNTDQNLASVNFVSNIDNVTLSNTAPFGGTNAGALQFDNADPVTIRVTFSAPPNGNTIARIYNNGSSNLVGTININAGAIGGATRIYPPIASDAFFVIVDPN
jgi:hypothetical protein